MKKAILSVLMLCLLGTALAAPNPTPTPTPLESSAMSFWDSLGDTWSAFTGMATEAGNAISEWANGVGKQVDAYLRANVPEVSAWLDEAAAYFTQNVSPELQTAWRTLTEGAMEVGAYTQEQLQAAYDALVDGLNGSAQSAQIKSVLDALANAAGLKVRQ